MGRPVPAELPTEEDVNDSPSPIGVPLSCDLMTFAE